MNYFRSRHVCAPEMSNLAATVMENEAARQWERKPSLRLTRKQVLEIRKITGRARDHASQFGISEAHFNAVRRREKRRLA